MTPTTRSSWGALLAVLLVVPCTASNQITVFDVAGATNTWAVSVNAAGQIAGFYSDTANVNHGFLREATGSIVTFDAPRATQVEFQGTFAEAINDSGQITGYFTKSGVPYGFLRDASGSFTTFAAAGDVSGTVPQSINASGQVAGYYTTSNFAQFGFVRSEDGTVISINALNSICYAFGSRAEGCTSLTSINGAGDVTGPWLDANSAYHGVVGSSNDRQLEFQAPKAGTLYAQGTDPWAINDKGEVAGASIDSGGVAHGFVRLAAGGFVVFDAPGAGTGGNAGTTPRSMNNSGQITGNVRDVNYNTHGFYRDPAGTITVFDAPNAGTGEENGTFPSSINALGQIVGTVSDAQGVLHGFVRE
jgi:hypothetical protein